MSHRKRKYLSCLVLSCLLIPVSLLSQKIIIVTVGQNWIDTGIDYNSGEIINILSEGLATESYNNAMIQSCWWATPDGMGGSEGWQITSSGHLVNGVPVACLVAKIGNGTPFYAGSHLYKPAPNTGRLYLAFNYYLPNPGVGFGYFVSFIYTKNTLSKVSENPSSKPSSLSLEQNFPNPFNPDTQIEYSLENHSFTTLKIYNTLGQEIKTLVNGVKDPGTYSVLWDGTDGSGQPVSSGQYFYQVSQDNQFTAKKAILLR